MAKPGERIVVSENEEIHFVQAAEDTAGEYLEIEVSYEPKSDKPPAHFHPNQNEFFEVIVGEITAGIDGEKFVYRPGDTFQVPAGTVHWMHNASEEPARLRWKIEPALRTEDFFESIWRLERERRAEGSSPNIFHFSLLLPQYSDEFRLAFPPFIIQRILFAVLSPVGRMLQNLHGW